MNLVEMTSSTLKRRRGRRSWRPNLQLSLLDTPMALPRRRQADAPPKAASKLASMELNCGGLAIEFKARNLSGLLAWLSLDVAAIAVLQELMRPPQFRTWHGRVAGLIPYDFRKPSLRRLLSALWAPENPRLFTDTAFGVGWSLNLAQLPRVLRGTWEPSERPAYSGPKVTTAP